MRRLRRSIGIGAALTLLALGAPMDGAAAAPEGPPLSRPGGQGDENRADPRKEPGEPSRSSGTPANAAATVGCGQTVTKNTTLTADVGPCQGDGIIIGADNITLNLNGRRVFGNNDRGASGEFAGIRMANRTGVTVTGHRGTSGKTGTVEGFEAGVLIRRGSRNTVENLTVQDNVGLDDPAVFVLGDGIVMFSSSNNRILNNKVFRNGYFGGIGGSGVGTDSNLIQGNTSSENLGLDGVVSPGSGIALSSGTPGRTVNDNSVIGNITERNHRSGINLGNTLRAKVLNNVANDNGRIDLGNSAGITMNAAIANFDEETNNNLALDSLFQGNTTNRNGQFGILLDRGSSENIVRENVASENGFIGIANGFRAFDNLYDSNTALGHFFDLYDGAFPDNPDQCGSVWVNNKFETAFPEDCID